MKAFFISGAILFTVIILILAFENLGISASGFLFILIPLEDPFFMVLSVAGIGVLAGVFYTGLITTLLQNHPEDEEDTGSEAL
ncbi:hypothetical protein KKC88_03200 [Patescibacteria group bacterium]|nr:hypothetical protein [Patescibacteria group bacterium]